ncbi:MAG: FadR/GntR family transcriptional regulator [Gaiellaceae bacterium]
MAKKADIFATPIARVPRLSDQVAEKLLETILERGLKPGDRLPSERELGEQFQVSRTVIREATRALVAKGIIDVRSGTGLTVTAVDSQAVSSTMNLYLRGSDVPYEQVHEVRSVLEIEVAGGAAERATDEGIAGLAAIHERLLARHQRGDGEGFSVADVHFHRQLAEMTGNDLFVVLLDAIGNVLLEIRRALSANEDRAIARQNQTGAVKAHKQILDAVAERDPVKAREAMRDHLATVYQGWISLRAASDLPA